MTEINGNLELEKDTEYGDNLLVHGNITGKDGKRYNLIVRGDINAWDINAVDIDAWDINASFILCATLKQKEGSKLLARHIIRNRSSYEQKDLSKSD